MAARLAAYLPDDEQPPTAELDDHLLWVWRAWWRLHRDRPWFGGGFGPAAPGRIAWRDVVRWAQVHRYPEDQRDFLDACIRAMDDVFSDVWAKKQTPPVPG